MTAFNHLSIKRRMFLSFTFIIVLFIVFGYVTLIKMNTLSRTTRELYGHPLQVSNASLKAKTGIISMHRVMKDLSTETSHVSISLAAKRVEDIEKDVYSELEIIRQLILGKEGKQMIEEAVNLFTGWKPIRMEVENLVLKGDTTAANRITKEKGAEYVARLERKMTGLTSYALSKAAGFMADARQARSHIVMNTVLFIFGLILITLLTGFLMAKSILSSIYALQKTMQKITETGEIEDAPLLGNNEITSMSRYFNGLLLKLREQFWMDKGENGLNQALSGNLSYEQTAKQGIEFIARYVEACAGALYGHDKDHKTCLLESTYAVIETQQFAKKFHEGEGIVGQVALEKKEILFKIISSDDALVVTGTLKRIPAAIFAVPLYFEDNFYGVLEIASIEHFSPVKLAFIRSCAQILSAMIHSAKQAEQIKHLLITSQRSYEKLQLQTEELQAQTEELQALNEEFQQQSNELKNQNIELEIQRKETETANQLKSQFLSNMSHELRTPLNSINALSRVLILQAADKLSTDETHYLEIIERNGKHLLALINDILDLSKIEAGRLDISLNHFSVSALITDIMDAVAPLAAQKDIVLESHFEKPMPNIKSDESRVHQILQNIIANAVKFTSKGRVDVFAETQKDMIKIRVKDTGIGIPAADLDSIFEEFRQIDGASTRKFEGTGLGLAIANKASLLLGGKIQVKSNLGEGSEFTIFLPIKCAEPASSLSSIKNSPMHSRQLVPGREKKTVLIVDDDPDIIDTLADIFVSEGYDTLTASNGKNAIDLAKKHQPFAITLDVLMPGMDGWEVLRELKNDPATAHIPVIVISKSNEADTAFALGAVGYIAKPVDREALIREIKKVYGYLPSTVLVADDNDIDRNEIARIVRSEGMAALTADNGKSCLAVLETTRPDILVLDLLMPEMNGFEVLENLRKNPETANLPVIVVTAKDLSAKEKKMLESHVSSILAKTDNSSDFIIQKIKDLLRKTGKKRWLPIETEKLKNSRILLVEDNEAAVIQVKKALEEADLHVDVAPNGREALEYVHQTLPQGIILDLMMPKIDGFQVLETIRSTPATKDIPVLILTAKDLTDNDLQRLSANHVQQLIHKGDVNKQELLEKVATMINPAEGDDISELTDPADDPPQLFSHPPHESPVILVVEDNPDNMTTLKAVIPDQYSIKEAIDGEQGLKMAQEIIPDLIFLDMSLPKMDGLSVVKKLKADKKTTHIPVIALTAQVMKGDKKRILDAGCDDYIAKPIDPETIIKRIDHWMEA